MAAAELWLCNQLVGLLLGIFNVTEDDKISKTVIAATWLVPDRRLQYPTDRLYHSDFQLPASALNTTALLSVTSHIHARTHTHTHLTALCPGLPGRARTRKVKPIWILLKQESVSGSGISWAICKSASRSRQITTPAPHHSVFYRPDALPAAQPTVPKHWRNICHLAKQH